MKLLHYFLGFNAFALAYWLFTNILSSLETDVYFYIGSCLLFSALASVAIYNIYEGYKKQRNDINW